MARFKSWAMEAGAFASDHVKELSFTAIIGAVLLLGKGQIDRYIVSRVAAELWHDPAGAEAPSLKEVVRTLAAGEVRGHQDGVVGIWTSGWKKLTDKQVDHEFHLLVPPESSAATLYLEVQAAAGLPFGVSRDQPGEDVLLLFAGQGSEPIGRVPFGALGRAARFDLKEALERQVEPQPGQPKAVTTERGELAKLHSIKLYLSPRSPTREVDVRYMAVVQPTVHIR